MTREETLTILADGVGTEEPVFLPLASLADIMASDIPADVQVSVGETKDGIMHVEWDGHFFSDGGQLKAFCQYIWTRKYWDAPLGMPFYMDLVKRAIETRQRTHKDVTFRDWDDDGAYIRLSYDCMGLPDTLADAYKAVLSRQKILEETAESVSQKAGINAAEAAQRTSGWGSHSFDDLVNIVETAKSSDDKGRSLEELVARLLASISGFTVTGRLRTETEEIDISVLNGSADPRFVREGALILVECKNWSAKCGKNEFVVFKEKIENRKGRCTLGLLVSWNGFKETVTKEMLRSSHEHFLVVPMDGQQIREAVRNNAFAQCIADAWTAAINT
jgi:Restriction endonuclease